MRLRQEFLVALLAIGVATAIGTTLDDRPPRPVEMRAGYRVLQADFHAHTRFSDGFLSPIDLVDHAARRGLDVIAVSEHNQVFPGKVARAYSNWAHGPTVVVAEEITTREFHMLAIGIEQRIDARKPLSQIIDDVHAQGGVIAAAHPTKRFASRYGPVLHKLDATELMHPIAFQGSASGIGPWTDMRDFYEDAKAQGHTLAPLGNSDFHAGSVLGLTRTFVFVEDDSAKGVVDAIRAKRTVTFDLEGKGYGDPMLLRSLELEPLEYRGVDYGYRSRSLLDMLGRSLGFLGVILLLAFRRQGATRATT